MDFDLILEEIGELGRYQITNYLLLCLPVLFAAANSLSYVFTAGIPNYRCFVPECDDPLNPIYDQSWIQKAVPGSVDSYGHFTPEQCLRFKPAANHTYFQTDLLSGIKPNDQCNKVFDMHISESCDHWVYDKTDDKTIVQEWGITCKENQYLLALIGTCHFTGIVIGSAAAGVLADNYGRKMVFILSTLFMAITGIGQAIATSYTYFATFALLNAIGTAGVFPLAFIIGVEMVGPRRREMSGIVLNYFYAVGEALVGIFAWWCKDWVSLQLIVSVPPLLFIGYYWIVPESIRWLLARNDIQRAGKIVKKAAKINGVELSETTLQAFGMDANDNMDIENEQKSINTNLTKTEKAVEHHEVWRTFKQVISSRILLIRGLILFDIWATNAFVFYGLSLNATSLSGNKYVNFILVCLVEIPGYSLSWILMNKIGRRWSLAGSLLMCAFTCVAGGFVHQDMTWAVVSLFLIGKLGITSAFSTSYVHTAEMLPTVIRSIGVGTASTVARLGALVAPFVPLLNYIYKPLPLLLFGFVSLIAGLLSLFLPETFGYKLPDTAEEAERIGRDEGDNNKMNIKVDVK